MAMRVLLPLLLYFASPAFCGAPKYSLVDGELAAPSSADNSYFRAAGHPAYDYWALPSFFYVPRRNGYSCSSAASAAALTSEKGLGGRHGLTLDQLASALRGALAAYGAKRASVAALEVSSADASVLEKFRAALAENEKNPDDIMLIHFTQDILTGAPGGPHPHVSPVGAYDSGTRRVLAMDVDREWYEPYWAADTQVLKAKAAETAAFGHGGYALIARKK